MKQRIKKTEAGVDLMVAVHPIPGGCAHDNGGWFNYYVPAQTYHIEYCTDQGVTRKRNSREWNRFEHYVFDWNHRSTLLQGCYSETDQWGGSGLPCESWYLQHRDPFWGWRSSATSAAGIYDPRLGLTDPFVQAGVGSENEGFVPAPSALPSLTSRAYKQMMPMIKAELSSINSLYELKDIVTLKRTVSTALGAIRAIHSMLRAHLDPKVVLTRRMSLMHSISTALKQSTKSAADIYLQLKFNILPLLSDIRGVKTALKKYHQFINKQMALAQKVREAHFTYSFQEFSDQYDQSYYILGPGSNQYYPYCRSTRTIRSYVQPSTFHTECRYNFSYSAFQHEYALLLTFLDSVGANFSPAIIWNAVPWTFVIDWVVSIGNFLDRLKVEAMRPAIAIEGFLWSIKRSRRIDCTLQTGDRRPWFTTGHAPMPTCEETAYRRELYMPNRFSLEGSGLSSVEFSLGVALYLSNRIRSLRRKGASNKWKMSPEPFKPRRITKYSAFRQVVRYRLR